VEEVDRLYSYIIKHDTGFAPNPFFGFCTLACCKPSIRRIIGRSFDPSRSIWVAGISPKSRDNRLVYAARVTEVLTFERYYRDKRFKLKRPQYRSGVVRKCGDNIYKPLKNGSYLQLRSTHSHRDGSENVMNKLKDVENGRYVLISSHFWYFGRDAIMLPTDLRYIASVGRGHRSKFERSLLKAFGEFISRQNKGVHAPPTNWPYDDISWATAVSQR
jgi:hypothetical protein